MALESLEKKGLSLKEAGSNARVKENLLELVDECFGELHSMRHLQTLCEQEFVRECYAEIRRAVAIDLEKCKKMVGYNRDFLKVEAKCRLLNKLLEKAKEMNEINWVDSLSIHLLLMEETRDEMAIGLFFS